MQVQILPLSPLRNTLTKTTNTPTAVRRERILTRLIRSKYAALNTPDQLLEIAEKMVGFVEKD